MTTRSRSPSGGAARGALKGCMRNVIVVKPPDRRFEQALFILRDDYFLTEGLSEKELLRQAREAAQLCAASAAPGKPRRFPWVFIPAAVLVVLGTLRVLGVI